MVKSDFMTENEVILQKYFPLERETVSTTHNEVIL